MKNTIKSASFILLLALAGGVISCKPGVQNNLPERATGPATPVSPQDRTQNDTALILAGLPVPPDSPLASLTKEAIFQRHALRMDRLWASLKKQDLDPISVWQAKEIPAPLRSRDVFYPLSGADFINGYSLFPDANDYLMIAMEDPGHTITLNQNTLPAALNTVIEGVTWFTQKNYFTTTGMRTSMKSQAAEGVMPLIMVFMVRLGHTIQHIDGVDVNKDGSLIVTDMQHAHGLRFIFRDGHDGRVKRLVYLQAKLDNSAADPSTPMGAFLQNAGRRALVLKSAVYLFHMKQYEKLRDSILSRSDIVVQDDSGIPYLTFKEDGNWDARFYGHFTTPMPLSEIPHPPLQPDLAAAFQREARPLPFSYGYGSLRGPDQSNLSVYVRKTLPGQ